MKLALVKKYWPFITLIVLLCIGFLLRSKMFLSGDFYFLPDQGRDMQLVKSIAIDHKITLIGGRAGLGGIFHGPLWWYLIVPFFLLAHGNPFFTLIPLFFLINFGIILTGFFIAKKLYGSFVAFLTAFFLTVSGEFINTIGFTSNSHVMPLIFLFYLFSIILFLRGKDKAILFSFLLAGIGIHFESAFAILLLPLTLFAFLFQRHMPAIKYILIGVFLFFLSIANFFLFDLRHQFLMTHSVITLLSGHVKPDKNNLAFQNLFFRIHDRVWWFFTTFRMTVFAETTLLVIFLSIIFVVGAVLVFKTYIQRSGKKADRESLFLLCVIALSYSFYIFYPLPLQSHYVQSLVIPAILLLALQLQKISTTLIGKIIVIVFLLLNIYPAISWISQNYFTPQEKYTSGSDGSYQNQLRAARYIFQDANGKPFGYFVYTPQLLTYGMDYLVYWQGKTSYHYIPENKKLAITYLIMYPGLTGDAHAHDFWKKNIIKTKGKVLLEKQLPGNIIIQKLSITSKEEDVDPNYYQNLIFR